jgi:hypothetical protein
MAILHGWFVVENLPDLATWEGNMTHPEPASFRRLSRDLYVPGGDVGFWQGAIRDPEDPCYRIVRAALDGPEPLIVDLLYGDQDGGQRTISRFRLVPRQDGEQRISTVAKHWYLDRAAPR